MSLAKDSQHLPKKIFRIVVITSIARSKPRRNHHPTLRRKGHQWMMTPFASTLRIVTQLASLLSSVTRQHARIQINRPAPCTHPLPKPARQVAKYLLHLLLFEPTKESCERRYTGHFLQIKDGPQSSIKSNQ